MKRIANILAAMMIASPAAMAFKSAVEASDLKLYDLNVEVDESAQKVRVAIELDVEKFSLGKDREMIFTPVLLADDGSDSLQLKPVIIAGRNMWYSYLRNDRIEEANPTIFRAGTKGMATVRSDFPLEPWMSSSTLEMRCETANCCDEPEKLLGPSPKGNVPLARIDIERPELEAEFIFAPPVDAGPVIKHIEGSAFVTFVVNRTELKPDYMINRQELAKIINSIEYVRKDPDATITNVHIKGFASPEGPYDNNVRLAKGRTETLRQYVRDLYHFNDTTITSSYEPEDWAGLKSYVADSMNFDITHRKEIISIIDGPLGFDNKDLAIRTQFPADYAVILKQIYPWLRHSDYKVSYAIKIYTDINEIRQVFATDPTRLRNVDFYTLAQTYPEGSDEYCNVFLEAVEVYPDDPMLNLNAANINIKRGQYDEAQLHLLKAGKGPEATYARGVLASKRGNYEEAAKFFNQAAQGGVGANEAFQAESLTHYYPVTYLITPDKKLKIEN